MSFAAGACLMLAVRSASAAALQGLSPLDAITRTLQSLPIAAVPDDTAAFDNATALLAAFKDERAPEAPFKKSLQDPEPLVGFFSCPRGINSCPEGFKADAQNHDICVPEPSYRGPCTSPISRSGMTLSAKSRWSDACQASWPCTACPRDYTGCPLRWIRSEDPAGAVLCEPPSSYVGACGALDVVGESPVTLESWASSCGAVWPCI
eukprot:TRINITY_DN114114_c0_g1_i1.p1 TRINITY_DN114114_c0_g1~~TRINITY_DN114114_c0_g1_i1.p1  ORF type:complete len:207 (-),score=28.21 TRINITY_DN114114_c0_g1_i1:92-712(-)